MNDDDTVEGVSESVEIRADEVQETEDDLLGEVQEAGSGLIEEQATEAELTEEVQVAEAEPTEEQAVEAEAFDAVQVNDSEETVPEGTDNVVEIEVASGMDSRQIANMLEAAGTIESAADFDAYLCSNGYDRKIRVGKFDIPTGATEEDIAIIITMTN